MLLEKYWFDSALLKLSSREKEKKIKHNKCGIDMEDSRVVYPSAGLFMERLDD